MRNAYILFLFMFGSVPLFKEMQIAAQFFSFFFVTQMQQWLHNYFTQLSLELQQKQQDFISVLLLHLSHIFLAAPFPWWLKIMRELDILIQCNIKEQGQEIVGIEDRQAAVLRNTQMHHFLFGNQKLKINRGDNWRHKKNMYYKVNSVSYLFHWYFIICPCLLTKRWAQCIFKESSFELICPRVAASCLL